MMNQTVPVEQHCHTHPFKRICWTAIFVGALVGLGLGFLLHLFGIAIGLSAVTMNKEGGAALAMGGALGILISVIVAMFLSGYAAGYLGRPLCPKRNLGILYGFTTWSVSLLLAAALMSHMSQYASNYSQNFLGTTANQKMGKNTEVIVAENKGATEALVITTASQLSSAACILFGLFFIGAISSCVGACCAMKCKKTDEI